MRLILFRGSSGGFDLFDTSDAVGLEKGRGGLSLANGRNGNTIGENMGPVLPRVRGEYEVQDLGRGSTGPRMPGFTRKIKRRQPGHEPHERVSTRKIKKGGTPLKKTRDRTLCNIKMRRMAHPLNT